MYAQATLYDYWMALYSRKGLILLVSVSAMVFTLVISRYLPPIYEAKATLFVPANDATSSYSSSSQQRMAQSALKPLPDEKEAGIHVGILKSDDMVEKIHGRFPVKEPGFFKKNVDFVTSPQFFIDIYVRDRDPELAAAIANSYVDLYAEFHARLLKDKAARTQRVLEQQLAEIEKKVASKTAEISEFKQRNKLLSSTEAEQLALNQSQQLERDRNGVIVELQAARERMGAAGQAGAEGAANGDAQGAIPNPMFDKIRRLEARKNALTERIDKLRDATRGTVTAIATMRRLESDKRILDELVTNVEMNLAEARMQSEAPMVNVVQVQTARPPKVPAFPIHALNAIVALVLGFAAACYAALLLEYLGRLKVERIRRNLVEDIDFREVTL